jgi:hypothetical protein
MKEEKSLTKVNNGFFSKLINNIRSKLFKINHKNSVATNTISTTSKNTALDDLEILKEVMNGKIHIQDLDTDTKNRLINMCKNRLEEIDKEIEKIHNKTEKMKQLTLELKQI